MVNESGYARCEQLGPTALEPHIAPKAPESHSLGDVKRET